jgi:hypothetical protein
MPVLLQITFSPSAEQLASPVSARQAYARELAELPGLRWKIWLVDKAAGQLGGVYLFDDRASAEAWAERSLRAHVNGGATGFTTHIFEVNEDLSAITRAPLAVLDEV